MFALLLACFVVACAAAPQYYQGHPPFYPQPEFNPGFGHHNHQYNSFQSGNFDARQFWFDIANKLRQVNVNNMLAQLNDKFRTTSSTQGFEGNQYIVTIPLKGFEEQDIVVIAGEGFVIVHAVHTLFGGEVAERSFLDIKPLPSTVKLTGSWTFKENVLKLVFPMKTDANTENVDVSVTETPVTGAPALKERSGQVKDHNNVDVYVDIDPRFGPM